MSSQELLYAVENGIATITFNRPEVRNAFGETTRPELLAALRRAEDDRAVGCVVITGAGSAFAAGGDVKSMAAMQADNDASKLTERMAVASEIVQLIPQMTTPVIAAINGPAAGAGMNLALACDIRYASDEAVFAESFVKIGLIPDWGGHYLLTRIVGTGRAMELMMLGDRIDAQTALKFGLVNELFPAAELTERVTERARALADGPRDTIAAIKRCVYQGASGTLGEVLDSEQRLQAELFLGADAREGIAAFVEKRRPNFT